MGKTKGMTGKHHSEKTKEKMRMSQLGISKPMSEETKQKISQSLKGKMPKNIVAGWNKGLKDIWTKSQLENNRLKHLGKVPWNKLYQKKIRRKVINGKQESHIIWCSQPENLSYIPKGFVIHHIDFNPLNNHPSNLFLMPKRDHDIYHSSVIKIIKGISIQEDIRFQPQN